MSDGLKEKTIKGMFWSFTQSIGQQGVQFVIAVILARLLLPEEFGLIAMLIIIVAITNAFINNGFGYVLIQKQDTTHLDESTVFYFNIILGFAMTGLLYLAAPWIAAFYERPILAPLARLMSLNLAIGSFGIVHTMLMTKNLDFKTQLKVGVIAAVISGVIGIAMAYNDFGVWSLAVQSLSNFFFRTVFLWIFYRWRPALAFGMASLRSMFSFGSKVLLTGLINTVFLHIYLIVIGKLFPAASLGFYSRANEFQKLPVMNLTTTVSRVTFPVFASVQSDNLRLKRGVQKALTAVSMINFPMMIGMAVVARPMILVLLTDKWLPCVPYLQLLCMVGLFYPLHAINLNVLVAQGRSDLFLKLEIIKRIIIVTSIAITYRWGVMAIIYGQFAVSLAAYILNTYYTKKLIDYSMWEQVGHLLPFLAVSSLMGAAVYSLHYVSFHSQLVLLIAQVILGIGLYTALCYVFKIQSFTEIMEIIKPKLRMFRGLD